MAQTKTVSLAVFKANVDPMKKGMRELRGESKRLDQALDALARGQQKQAATTNKVINDNRRLRASLHQLRRQADRTKTSFVGLRGSIAATASSFVGITALVYGLGRALAYGTRKGLSFDRQLTVIQKTTKLSVKDMGLLEDRIKGISRARGIDRDQVAAAGVIGGRLGVADVNDLTELLDVAVSIEKSTDLDAARAVEVLSRVHALTGTPVSKLRDTADALVHIGNKAPIGEAAVADLAVRLAATLSLFRAAPADIIAFSSALAIAEGQAEGASTFFYKLFGAVNEVAEEGGAKFEQMADIMGRSSQQLRRDLEGNFIDTMLELLGTIKEFDQVSQKRIFGEIFDLTDLRGLRNFFRTIPTLQQTVDLSRSSAGATDIEERIRLEQVSGKFDTSVEAIKAGFLAVTGVIDQAVLPAFNAMAAAVNSAREAVQAEEIARKENIELIDAVRDPSTSRMRAQAIAAAQAAEAGDLSPGAARGILARITPSGMAPGDLERTPSRQDLEDAIYIRHLDQQLRRHGGDFETRAELAEELNALISSRAQNAIDAIIEEAPPGTPATGGSASGGRVFGGGNEDLLGALGIDPSALAGGRGRARGQRALASRLAQSAALATIPLGPSVLGGRGSAAGEFEARGALTRQANALREAEGRAELEDLRRQARDERRLTRMLRQGESADEIRHEEAMLALRRRYLHAKATLEGEALDAELARIERRREELKKEDPRAHEALADAIAGGVTDAIAAGTSIRDAWKALMNELAADLLREQILDPFKQALKGLIIESMDAIFGQGGRVGPGDSILGSVLGSVLGGGFGGAGGGYGGPAGGPIPLAAGGSVVGAGMALVGERGPELLSLGPPARVTPLGGAGSGNTYNISIVSEDRVAMKRVVQEELPGIIASAEANMLAKSRGNSRVARAFG